jgi:hypothetical protein
LNHKPFAAGTDLPSLGSRLESSLSFCLDSTDSLLIDDGRPFSVDKSQAATDFTLQPINDVHWHNGEM